MENFLELKLDYENEAYCRTHYKGKFENKTYNIVILHHNNFDEICTATKDGEPNAPLKKGIQVLLNNKKYIVADRNGYSVLEEI